MRALILGSDFVKLPNGDIKVLEVNTNTGVLTKGVQYLDFSPIEQLITSNSFTEVHLIFNDRNFLMLLSILFFSSISLFLDCNSIFLEISLILFVKFSSSS